MEMNMHINYLTKNAYQGKNQAELSEVARQQGFTSNAWLTFLQARQAGLKIKKGSKAAHVFRGFEEVVTKNNKIETRPLGWANVFNLDQTEEVK
jgi:antirestriction protein ArdC